MAPRVGSRRVLGPSAGSSVLSYPSPLPRGSRPVGGRAGADADGRPRRTAAPDGAEAQGVRFGRRAAGPAEREQAERPPKRGTIQSQSPDRLRPWGPSTHRPPKSKIPSPQIYPLTKVPDCA